MDDSDHRSWELKVQILVAALCGRFVIFYFFFYKRIPCHASDRFSGGRPFVARAPPFKRSVGGSLGAQEGLQVPVDHPEDGSDREKIPTGLG